MTKDFWGLILLAIALALFAWAAYLAVSWYRSQNQFIEPSPIHSDIAPVGEIDRQKGRTYRLMEET